MVAAPSQPRSKAPSPADISGFLLELHERSNELGHHELYRFTLERLPALLPFDAGLLAMGTVQDGVPHGHDYVLHNRDEALMASWDLVKHEDRVAAHAFANPGRTANFDVEGPIFDGCEKVREHSRRWKLAHVLCTSMISQELGLYWVMSLYREDPDDPFSEAERQAKELIVPHVFAAARRARVGQLRARTRVPDAHGQAGAIAHPSGLVLEAEPGFAELLRLGFPDWRGPFLPPEVKKELPAKSSVRVMRGAAVVRADAAANGFVLLHVRKTVIADQLTSREREIAEAFSMGETYREIGERLGVSPNTVRRHLANIYEKLGISSKVELERMLSDVR